MRDCSATMVPRTNGEALLAWHRVRPPCGYLDRVAGAGMAKALGRYGGHCRRWRKGIHDTLDELTKDRKSVV